MSFLTRRQFIGAATGMVVAGSGLSLPARGLTINPRSSWTSEPPTGPLSSEDVRFLIVHHSASHNGHSAGDVPAILRSWYNYHTGPEKGWPDIAYNFIIDSAGGIWEGRQGSLAGPVAGSATGGNQGFTQLVCLIGDTNQSPATPEAHASLVQVLAWLADRYAVSTTPGAEVTFTSRGSNKWPEGAQVTTPTVAGHRDMSQTTCPGNSLYSYVAGSLTTDVETVRGGSAPPPPPPSSTTTSTAASTTSSTAAAPTSTTTVAPTTTVPPNTTTTVRATTTTREATTTVPAPTTTTPATIAPVTPTTLSIAAASTAGSETPAGLLATVGAMFAIGAGVLVWRYRRMRN